MYEKGERGEREKREGRTRETFRLIQKHVATRIAWQENFPHKKDKSENGKKMRDSEKEYVPILFARPYHARCHNPWIIVSRLSSYIYRIVSNSFNTHLHFIQLKPFCMIFFAEYVLFIFISINYLLLLILYRTQHECFNLR